MARFPASHKLKDAQAFLRVELMAGPRRASEVENLARAQGIARSTLAEARKRLGILSERVDNQWIWRYHRQKGKV